MAFLYLIKEEFPSEKEIYYKIGITKEKDPYKRLKKLQTGNPNILSFQFLFETKYPYKLESIMHEYYKNQKMLNEWYDLTQSDIENFMVLCENKEKIIDGLKENPYLFKK